MSGFAAVAWIAGILVAQCPRMDAVVNWPSEGAPYSELVERVASAAACPYVVAPSAHEWMRRPSIRLTSSTSSVGSALEILDALSGLRAWIGEGVTVWFGPESRPGLLGAESRQRGVGRSGGFVPLGVQAGTIEIEDAAPPAAFAAVTAAFGIPVAYPEECALGSARVTLLAADIDPRTALAILSEALMVEFEWGRSCLMVSACGENADTFLAREKRLDMGELQADIQEAIRLCRSACVQREHAPPAE